MWSGRRESNPYRRPGGPPFCQLNYTRNSVLPASKPAGNAHSVPDCPSFVSYDSGTPFRSQRLGRPWVERPGPQSSRSSSHGGGRRLNPLSCDSRKHSFAAGGEITQVRVHHPLVTLSCSSQADRFSQIGCDPQKIDQASVRSVISGGQFTRSGTPMVPMPRFT